MMEEPPRNRLGTASFVIGLVGLLLFLTASGVAVFHVYTPGGGGAMSPLGLVVSFSVLLVLVANAIGLILGAVALFSKGMPKVLAAIGLLLNILPVATIGVSLA